MSKSIKVSDEVYNTLLRIQQPRETLSQIVEKVLRVYITLFQVTESLGPGHYLKEKPKEEEVKTQ